MSAPGLTCTRCERPLYPHLARATDNGWQHANRCPQATRVELEDVEWMVETGECLAGAAARLGFKTPGALEQHLRRQGRVDLAVILVARNPRDWNRTADGKGLTRAVGGQVYAAKEARRNEKKKQMRRERVAA